MCEVKRVKAGDMFPVISEILQTDTSVKITVTGWSMYPFLREGEDCVELSKTCFDSICRGDIVLIKRRTGEYILHRVLTKKADCFYMVGDAQQWIEGPLAPEQLTAVVTAVWRKGKRICCSSTWWRLLSALWLRMLPFRCFIINTYRRLRGVRR
ncbi:MAG: S24/S26 family peptidase [Clostridia bacterium]|nr:S24/S26 family peptidase [Clostridia bacterium]